MTAPHQYDHLLGHCQTDQQRTAIGALLQYGSQNAAADALGWKRTKLQSALRAVQRRAAILALPEVPEPPKVTGRVSTLPVNPSPAPAPQGGIRRYLLTCAQNNTPVHGPFLANLIAFGEHIGAQLMVARFSYNKGAFASRGAKPDREPTAADTEGLWYDPALDPYICDDPARHGSCRWELAPGPDGIVWCAEMNVLPTATCPLSGLETYSGAPSAVFPHAKIAMQGTPVILANRLPRFIYTTGAVTQRNYIQRKAGIKAEFHHAYGALLVEVDEQGHWWARQICADDNGTFQDLWTLMAGGRAHAAPRIEAIHWGDIHAVEIDADVAEINWGTRPESGGVLDLLQPRHQIWHDTFSMRSRSHHEVKKFFSRYAKWCGGEARDSVEYEVAATRALMVRAHRDWCQMVVVSSNHDEHPDKWLDEADPKDDLVNAEFLLEGQLAKMRAIRTGADWNWLKWAVIDRGDLDVADLVPLLDVRWLGQNESFELGPAHHPVEMGQHGHLGPNGSRGSIVSLSRVPVRSSIGHSHTAGWRDGVRQTGVCQLKMSYANGPSSWSITHNMIYASGKCCLLTQRNGRLWA